MSTTGEAGKPSQTAVVEVGNGCLLCAEPVSDPVDFAPQKPWWPAMVTCLNPECVAYGVNVAADPEQQERDCFDGPDRTEPKFAHTDTERGFVSTIYRRSSAPYGGWYYETHGYLLTADGERQWLYEAAAHYPRRALKTHAILAKRLARAYPSTPAATTGHRDGLPDSGPEVVR